MTTDSLAVQPTRTAAAYRTPHWFLGLSRDLLHHRLGVLGGGILLVVVLLTAGAPWIAPYDPLAKRAGKPLDAPSATNVFGTDLLGRDLFSRVLYGGRISLTQGVVAVVIALVGGCALGLISGYFGGWTDNLISRSLEIALAFPGILMALIIIYILGPGPVNVMIAVGISDVPSFARLVRGSVLSTREEAYIEAARVVGCRNHTIIIRHVLPNIVGPVIVLATITLAAAILSAAGLSFLGMGASAPTPEWGVMLSEGRDFIREAWWLTTFPGLAIMISVLGMNLFGDALRDVFDPRLRRR